jgi:hypothetical protein
MEVQKQERPHVDRAVAAEPVRAPAGARLLDYFGHGTELAVIPGGMVLAVQAEHLVEA